MKAAWSLSRKLVVTGATFLFLALAATGVTLWISWHLEGGAAAVNEAGRLRMLTYRLALALQHGERAAAQEIAGQFEGSLLLLRAGDPARPLFVPWSDASEQRFGQVQAGWTALARGWLGPLPRTAEVEQADAFVAEIDRFVQAIEGELADWTSLLHAVQFLLMMLALAAAVALLYAAHLFVLQPVDRLKQAVASLRQGNLAARVEVESRDEFGELSAGFNDMAGHLQQLYASLEERVAEKTARLETKRRRLADLYEVSAFVAGATQIDELARGFAQRLRRIARAQGAAVRWSDETNRRYVLLAADGLPQDMLRDEACLDTGACACGQPREEARTRVIPIRSEAAALGHCARFGFSSLVSVPIRLHERLLGEVDLFFTGDPGPGADRGLLEALTGHLAAAMEGLRAAALEREAAVAQERTLLASELHDSIAQSLAFLKIQVQLLRTAVDQQDRPALERAAGELDEGVRETYADVRELLVHFRTRTSEEDIGPALETTLAKFEHQTGLRTQLRLEARGMALPPDVQVQVLHIVQEALSNARKHAGASQVSVSVAASPDWRFEVRDDGCGFEADGGGRGESHVGLRIMRERAARIGARVEVRSRPGEGCTVVLELPAAAVSAPAEQHEEAVT
ncbi:MAG TPA: type IV pili methyl-accepting chemotaxis transducer N-terminal domain-containing protein [Ramlibacter sp.]|nr:type IV pili methyl-accepting chemotaxis transducer N-terminal domain-containing protein [Ramlibacter sp.]